MATFKKLKSGKWQAQVARAGIRKSASFSSKRESKDWAARQEYLITEGDIVETKSADVTFGDLMERYEREVSRKKRSSRFEATKISALMRHSISQIQIPALRPADFAAWRDERLEQVAPATVNREMTIFSSILNVALREWGVIDKSPLFGIRRPNQPAPRDRRVSVDEVERLMDAAGRDLKGQGARTVHAFRFAIETAMRLGEICGLQADDVDFTTRVATLPQTKNGTMRKVPLSSTAIELLEALPASERGVFGLEMEAASALFRKVRLKAGIHDLTFHDSRHEAITRLAGKLDVLSLARMVGHKDIRMLQVYYNETAEELARRLG